jgi:hypothetical protein
MTSNVCWDCGHVIPTERLIFLVSSGVPEERLTCLKHANTSKVKGIYSGENGTSDIILCTKVYNDSVRTKFREVEENVGDEESTEV